MAYTVKQLASLAGVSVRTLHYYDQIGLLIPESIAANGYRSYGEGSVLRLQQIMFFKELGFSLEEIGGILAQPDFDRIAALEAHRETLQARSIRLEHLIQTVDRTILHLKGKIDMEDNELFEGFSEEKQEQYLQEIRQRYGPDSTGESEGRWNAYTPQQKVAIKANGERIFKAIAADMPTGFDHPITQEHIRELHDHLGFFYTCSYERFLGLGQMYNSHPDFIANFSRQSPELPAFLEKAITYYCQQHTHPD